MHETSYSSLILIVCSSCKLTLHWQNYTPSNFQYCMNFCHFKAKGLSKAKAVSYSISHSVRNMNCLCCVFPPHVLCDPVSLSLIVHLILVCLVLVLITPCILVPVCALLLCLVDYVVSMCLLLFPVFLDLLKTVSMIQVYVVPL